MTSIPLHDSSLEYELFREEVAAAARSVLKHGRITDGPEVTDLEEKVAAFCGVELAVAVSSGSDALVLALRALRVGPGDAVVTTPFSSAATAEAIVRVGARPLFVDIDAEDLNLDPDRVARFLQEECAPAEPAPATPRFVHLASGARVRAMLPVHLFGRLAGMKRLRPLARSFGLHMVEDAAHAFGVRGSDGGELRAAGAWGELGCHSFTGNRVFSALGAGGMLTTDDPWLAREVRRLRDHGAESGRHTSPGYHSKLDSFQAAVLLRKLPWVEGLLEERRRLVARYRDLFDGAERRGLVGLPAEPVDGSHGYNRFVIRLANRQGVSIVLQKRGVAHDELCARALHLEPCFFPWRGEPGSLPVAERVAGELLGLPLFPGLRRDQQEVTVEAVLSQVEQLIPA